METNLDFKKLIPTVLTEFGRTTDNIVVINYIHLNMCLYFLKNHIYYQYNLLTCISCVDTLNLNYRFSLSYELLSIAFNSRIRVKVFIDEFNGIESSTKTFINAN